MCLPAPASRCLKSELQPYQLSMADNDVDMDTHESNVLSAHAACSRTSGSSLSSACASAPMPTAIPTFPSTTAAFRCNPASFARFIGDFLNAALNASSVNARMFCASVSASFPAVNSRALNGESSANS